MSTNNSMNIHDVLRVEIVGKVIDEASEDPLKINKYKFTDDEGNVFTVTAFMKEGASHE